MPFVDPFKHACYLHEFQVSSLMIGLTHPLAIPIRMGPLPQEPSQEPLAPPCVPRVAPAYPGRLEAVSERVRLTLDQAISIFNHRETKTEHTAALLSAEYGISSKDIRDIWTRKSWAHDTRLYWTLRPAIARLGQDQPWK